MEKVRITGLIIIGEERKVVNKREQLCYTLRAESVDDGTIFHVVKKNFSVQVAPSATFPSELPAATPAVAEVSGESEGENEQNSFENVSASVGATRVSRKDIVDLRSRGIKVDDDNEPAPENAEAPPETDSFFSHRFTKPTFCMRR